MSHECRTKAKGNIIILRSMVSKAVERSRRQGRNTSSDVNIFDEMIRNAQLRFGGALFTSRLWRTE